MLFHLQEWFRAGMAIKKMKLNMTSWVVHDIQSYNNSNQDQAIYTGDKSSQLHYFSQSESLS